MLTREYLEITRELSAKLEASRPRIQEQCPALGDWVLVVELDHFRRKVTQHIDLLDRRVLQGQTIPAAEKVYSLFEPHTEWINQGEAHVGVELGHRILLATEQNQLIIDYRVPAGVDVNESLGVADRLLGRYGDQAIASLSFATKGSPVPKPKS